ncbi:glycosyl transferase family 8 protein [Cystoisospora suis]|uniref:Glycosyl transferase family 8 protein n=1 Tax=Cystoisospora suis TaxID=483139 RepID=A0A2C6L413_9APIC|nr:glycosyl transferase family 8 protein [Cystoisospora suis]
MPRHAYATLLTSDSFYPGVEALLKSLERVGARDPLILLYTASVSRSTIHALCHTRQGARSNRLSPRTACPSVGTSSDKGSFSEGRHSSVASQHDTAVDKPCQSIAVIPREVAEIPHPQAEKCQVPDWNTCFTKLRVWEQGDFDCIVYLDADTIVLQRIDELFLRQPLPAFAPDVFPPDKFNAGVIVLKPDRQLFQQMLSRVPDLPSHDGGDTGFLNSFFSGWYEGPAGQRLPFRYNALRTVFHITYRGQTGYWDSVRPIKVLHYCSSPKPWQENSPQTKLEKLWWDVFTGVGPTDSGLI